MKRTIFALALGMLLSMPCSLHAEEMEIQLMEVINVGFLPGDNPMDNPDHVGKIPPCPSCFHATINGHALSIIKLEPAIPSAQATVVDASTGGVVLYQQFSNSMSEQIAPSGVYLLHIETEGGELVGRFVVQ